LTNGTAEKFVEDKLNDQLKYNGDLRVYLMAGGPVARAIENSGIDKVTEKISEAINPYVQANGHVIYRNKFRIVTTEN